MLHRLRSVLVRPGRDRLTGMGDSATQVLTPLNPYLIVLLTMLRKYEPQAGLGTIIARMLPFAVTFWVGWVAVQRVFYFLDLQMGPGNGIMIPQ